MHLLTLLSRSTLWLQRYVKKPVKEKPFRQMAHKTVPPRETTVSICFFALLKLPELEQSPTIQLLLVILMTFEHESCIRRFNTTCHFWVSTSGTPHTLTHKKKISSKKSPVTRNTPKLISNKTQSISKGAFPLVVLVVLQLGFA